MSLTGDPDGEPYRAGISVFDVMAGLHATIGVLAALNARHDTGRGQHVEVNLLVLGAVRPGQPVQRVRRQRHRPDADGQQPPEPVPLRAAALLRRRPDHHRRQQRPVPQAGRGARRPRARRRPAVRAQRGPHRQPGRAAAAAGRAAAAPARRTEWFQRDHRARVFPAGRSTPSTAASRSPRRSGSTRSSRSAKGEPPCPSVRNPITFSETPPTTCCHPRARRARGRDPAVAGNEEHA